MDKHIETSSGSSAPEQTFFTPARGPVTEIKDDSGLHGDFDAIAQAFFAVDGHTSHTLMPYPHDPFREPAPWKAYDHLSVKDRIEQMRSSNQFSNDELDVFEGITNGSGLTSADKRGFTEFLFWWALGGHSMAGITAANGVYKIGRGGMTEFARNLLADYHGDLAFDAEVEGIQQVGEKQPVKLSLRDGRTISAGDVISTVPL